MTPLALRNKKSRPGTLVFLLLLLVAAIMNLVFVHYAFNPAPEEVHKAAAPAITGGGTLTSSSSVPEPLVFKNKVAPWTAHIDAIAAADYKYLIRITSQSSAGQYLTVDSFSADIREPGSQTPTFVPIFAKKMDGVYEATVTFPKPGAWEVRVRLQRANDMLESYERVEIK